MAKCDVRICAYGTIDEVNAILGMARSLGIAPRFDHILQLLQHQMFELGAELASPQADDQATQFLQEEDVVQLESLIDSLEETLPELKSFILPGGSQAAAILHLARCLYRRAEREIVALSREAPVRPAVLKYVNRVSDLLFVLARSLNAEEGVGDVPWKQGSEGPGRGPGE